MPLPASSPRKAADSTFESEPKRAIRLADLIQRDLARGRIRAGQVFGSEEWLLWKYDVGLGTLREALRILECRGTGRMRRGPNGGLVVALPSVQIVSQAFASQALLAAAQPEHLGEALYVLDDLAKTCAANPIVQTFAQCLDGLNEHVSHGRLIPLPNSASDQRRISVGTHRAGQIAQNIVADVLRTAGGPGVRFGSEADLCRRYGISKSTARQTVRLLEDAGVIHSERGRGRGLFVAHPGAGHTVRTLCFFLQAHGVTSNMSWEVGKRLSVAIGRLAAEHAGNGCRTSGKPAAVLLEQFHREMPSAELQHLFAIDQAVEAACPNPILGMMIQSLKSYSALATSKRDIILSGFSARYGSEYLAHTRVVVDAILGGDARAAGHAQELKNQFFEDRVRG